MAFPIYLAMTAAEFRNAEALPEHPAWMACHFSCYGTGLSNLPEKLPAGAMVILNDRTPVYGHDPELVAQQLSDLADRYQVSRVLLDFQRPGCSRSTDIAAAIVAALRCPVGVSKTYAAGLDCPVFLPPAPLHKPLAEYLQPWKEREIWLEAALDGQTITVTPEGSHFSPVFPAVEESPNFPEDSLFCRYHTEVYDSKAVFTLFRTPDSLKPLLNHAESLGVTLAVGLYQEIGKYSS